MNSKRVVQKALTKYGILARLDWPKNEEEFKDSMLKMYSISGDEIWTSEVPSPGNSDYWANPFSVLSEEEVLLVSLHGWECTIKLSNGRILTKEWVK